MFHLRLTPQRITSMLRPSWTAWCVRDPLRKQVASSRRRVSNCNLGRSPGGALIAAICDGRLCKICSGTASKQEVEGQMRCRWIVAMGIAAMIAGSEWVDPTRVTGQAPTSSTRSWAPPRTGWGHPDLQGVWNFASDTPMERPAEFGNRASLTDEELAKRAQATVERRFKQDNRQSAVESGPAGLEGAGGNYNLVWTEHPRSSRQTSFVIDPPDGRIPPHTPAAKRSYAELEKIRKGIDLDAPTPGGFVEDLGPRGLFTRCILGFNSGPPMTPCCYNENVQIFQTPDQVVLLNEIVHSARIIPLDGRPHVSHAIRQWMGDSRGRWENNTL